MLLVIRGGIRSSVLYEIQVKVVVRLPKRNPILRSCPVQKSDIGIVVVQGSALFARIW